MNPSNNTGITTNTFMYSNTIQLKFIEHHINQFHIIKISNSILHLFPTQHHSPPQLYSKMFFRCHFVAYLKTDSRPKTWVSPIQEMQFSFIVLTILTTHPPSPRELISDVYHNEAWKSDLCIWAHKCTYIHLEAKRRSTCNCPFFKLIKLINIIIHIYI